MQRYGSLNSKKFSTALSEPMEKDASSKVTEKLECIQEAVHSNAPLSDEKKLESPPRRKSSSVSLAFFLSKDADNERLEKAITKSKDDDSKKSDNLTIPEDFLCPISLELMKDPVIVSTGQV